MSTSVTNLVRVRKGFGKHFDSDGTEHLPEVPFDDPTGRLHLAFPDKIERVSNDQLKGAMQMLHPCGEDVSDKFVDQCNDLVEANDGGVAQVYLKGRRYRILLDGEILDTEPARLVNVRQVAKAVKALCKDIVAARSEEATEETETEEETE